MSTISVVIPVWNDAGMLRSCLDSLARQTRPADEVIVVDNASTDDTVAVAHAAGARVISQSVHGILPSTVAGFDSATGDIIARLDADSVAPEDWLEHVERILDGAPARSAVTGPGDFYGANALVRQLGRVVYLGGYFWAIGALLGHSPLFASNLALRSTLWEELRPDVDPNVADVHDDLHLSFRIRPDMTVIYDRTLRVALSARPFASWRGLFRRFWWAWRTVRVNTREVSARRRRAQRRRVQSAARR